MAKIFGWSIRWAMEGPWWLPWWQDSRSEDHGIAIIWLWWVLQSPGWTKKVTPLVDKEV